MKSKLKHLKHYLIWCKQLYLMPNHTPIIIYQMGKFGSSSIYYSLQSQGIKPVFHIHRLNIENIEGVKKFFQERHMKYDNNQIEQEQMGIFLYNNLVKPQKKTKFISLVRDPISRNISGFFNNLHYFIGSKFNKNQDYKIKALIEKFLQKYPHQVPLEWFDREIKQTLRIDVFAYEFPQETGYFCLRRDDFELLVLKVELEDQVKEEIISDFLDLPEFKLQQRNVGAQKSYADTYKNFCRQIKLPKTYLDSLCQSKYTQHFYSPQEITQIYDRWSSSEIISESNS